MNKSHARVPNINEHSRIPMRRIPMRRIPMRRIPMRRIPMRRIPMRAIRAVAKQIADKFQPDKIILFGSYAYGKPRPESDVDLLVVMDTSLRSRQQRLEISRALSPRPFPLDVIVHTPQQIQERLEMGDLFLREITSRGKVIYERSRA